MEILFFKQLIPKKQIMTIFAQLLGFSKINLLKEKLKPSYEI